MQGGTPTHPHPTLLDDFCCKIFLPDLHPTLLDNFFVKFCVTDALLVHLFDNLVISLCQHSQNKQPNHASCAVD